MMDEFLVLKMDGCTVRGRLDANDRFGMDCVSDVGRLTDRVRTAGYAGPMSRNN